MGGPAGFIPYGRQSISQEDIDAVVAVLRSDWLTTGPMVGAFEAEGARACGVAHGVAVNSGTAALHAAFYAAGVGPGDEVIVPSLTFAATANAAVYLGARPVFAEVSADTGLIDPADVARKLSPATKVVVAVDYAGQPCDYPALRAVIESTGRRILLVADACHSLGGSADGVPVGRLADLSCLSFHPVKNITTAEGGMVVTQDADWARRMRIFRNHGISTDHRERQEKGLLHYQMVELGFNYRLSDVLCALGISQLKRLPGWIQRRNEIAARYRKAFADVKQVTPLRAIAGRLNAYHLFVVSLAAGIDRDQIFRRMRDMGIGVNFHYPPVHLHPYYQEKFGTGAGQLPVTESLASSILSLPIFPDLQDAQVDLVVDSLQKVLR